MKIKNFIAMNIKALRKKILKDKGLTMEDFAQYSGVNLRSLYRLESNQNFINSNPVKYLIFLQRNGIDLNQLLTDLINEK